MWSILVDLRWVAKQQKTCMYLRPNLSSTKVNASQRKLMQVDASGWPNETQVERRSKACIDLRVHLARALVSVFLFPFYFSVCGSLSVTVLVFVLKCACTSGDLCRLFLVIFFNFFIEPARIWYFYLLSHFSGVLWWVWRGLNVLVFNSYVERMPDSQWSLNKPSCDSLLNWWRRSERVHCRHDITNCARAPWNWRYTLRSS